LHAVTARDGSSEDHPQTISAPSGQSKTHVSGAEQSAATGVEGCEQEDSTGATTIQKNEPEDNNRSIKQLLEKWMF